MKNEFNDQIVNALIPIITSLTQIERKLSVLIKLIRSNQGNMAEHEAKFSKPGG